MTSPTHPTRRAILEAANRIVQEQGVERLTLELTARQAGISKGGLLYHFGSKDALIAGMIQAYIERFTADLEAAAAQEPPEQPGRWVRAYLQVTSQDRQRTPAMSSGLLAAVATNPALLEPMQRAFRAWVDHLDHDGLDAHTTHIIRLAVDGLWMVELFGLAAPDEDLRQHVIKALDTLSQPGLIKS